MPELGIGSDLVQRLRVLAEELFDSKNKKLRLMAKTLTEAADRLVELGGDLGAERATVLSQSVLIEVLTDELKKLTAWPPRTTTK